VVGDTAVAGYENCAINDDSHALNGRAMAEINGQQIDLSNAYAPAGVTFNYCEGLDDAGQILVWANGQWPEEFDPGNKTASYLLTPALRGDANLDGKVDINDLTVVLTNFGRTTGVTWTTGDFVGDGTVDINDLTIVLANFGGTIGSSAGAMAAVPEPASLVLLGAAATAVLALSRRRRKRLADRPGP
jgi:hypothetical protein